MAEEDHYIELLSRNDKVAIFRLVTSLRGKNAGLVMKVRLDDAMRFAGFEVRDKKVQDDPRVKSYLKGNLSLNGEIRAIYEAIGVSVPLDFDTLRKRLLRYKPEGLTDYVGSRNSLSEKGFDNFVDGLISSGEVIERDDPNKIINAEED